MPSPYTVSQHTISMRWAFTSPKAIWLPHIGHPSYTPAGFFIRVAAQQGRDRAMHSVITGGSYSKIQFHSQQPTRHYCGNTCGCTEYKDKVVGHIWNSHIHRSLQAKPYMHRKGMLVQNCCFLRRHITESIPPEQMQN